MKLYMIHENGAGVPAVLVKEKLYRFRDLGLKAQSILDLICEGREECARLQRFVSGGEALPAGVSGLDPEGTPLLSPILRPVGDIVCIGVNYDDHLRETKHINDLSDREATVYFSKRADRILGTGEAIPDYPFVDSLDYEVELAAVLGRDVRNYDPDRDPDPVFGYSVFNDVSARNLQFRHKQWYVGKSLDGYSILGPCIVTADEIPDVQALEICCRVNGEVRQKSNTAFMIQTVRGAVAELSQGMTLQAGTVLATGTPGGVALGMQPPAWLKAGDVVECSVEGIGSIVNRVG